MKYKINTLKQFYLLFIFTVLLSVESIAADRPNFEPFAGSYQGIVFQGSDDIMLTTLRLTQEGHLRGEYSVKGSGGSYKGTLSNPRLIDQHTISFEWTDQYGEGYEVLEFSNDFNRYSGFWSTRESPVQNPMSGQRR